MKNEIERKFFVKELPDLSKLEPLHYERYYLENSNGKEVRISKVNETYIYEEKLEISKLERTTSKKEISKTEFNKLKQQALKGLIRDSYQLSNNPDISIKIYNGRFEGLIRAEVEFNSEEDAMYFVPLEWMGEEMTDLPIARDGKLIELTDQEFKKYIGK